MKSMKDKEAGKSLVSRLLTAIEMQAVCGGLEEYYARSTPDYCSYIQGQGEGPYKMVCTAATE